MMEIVSFKRY